MTRKVILSVAVVLAMGSLAQAWQKVTKAESISATATIQAIDKANRLVTLKDEKGAEDTMIVGPEMTRFDELKVGDKVKVTYYESLVLQVRKPGDAAKPADEAKLTKGTSGSPSATLSRQQSTSVDVLAIDPKLPSITVKTANGRTVTRKVEDPKNLEGVKVGDKIDITYTQAAIVSVEPVK